MSFLRAFFQGAIVFSCLYGGCLSAVGPGDPADKTPRSEDVGSAAIVPSGTSSETSADSSPPASPVPSEEVRQAKTPVLPESNANSAAAAAAAASSAADSSLAWLFDWNPNPWENSGEAAWCVDVFLVDRGPDGPVILIPKGRCFYSTRALETEGQKSRDWIQRNVFSKGAHGFKISHLDAFAFALNYKDSSGTCEPLKHAVLFPQESDRSLCMALLPIKWNLDCEERDLLDQATLKIPFQEFKQHIRTCLIGSEHDTLGAEEDFDDYQIINACVNNTLMALEEGARAVLEMPNIPVQEQEKDLYAAVEKKELRRLARRVVPFDWPDVDPKQVVDSYIARKQRNQPVGASAAVASMASQVWEAGQNPRFDSIKDLVQYARRFLDNALCQNPHFDSIKDLVQYARRLLENPSPLTFLKLSVLESALYAQSKKTGSRLVPLDHVQKIGLSPAMLIGPQFNPKTGVLFCDMGDPAIDGGSLSGKLFRNRSRRSAQTLASNNRTIIVENHVKDEILSGFQIKIVERPRVLLCGSTKVVMAHQLIDALEKVREVVKQNPGLMYTWDVLSDNSILRKKLDLSPEQEQQVRAQSEIAFLLPPARLEQFNGKDGPWFFTGKDFQHKDDIFEAGEEPPVMETQFFPESNADKDWKHPMYNKYQSECENLPKGRTFEEESALEKKMWAVRYVPILWRDLRQLLRHCYQDSKESDEVWQAFKNLFRTDC